MLRIKEVIKEKGFTVAKTAEFMGIEQSSLSRIISGGNTTVEMLKKIANVLEVHVSELFQKDCELYGLVTYQGKTYKIETKEQLMSLVDEVNQEKKGSN